MPSMRVLILGATGMIGGEILRELTGRPGVALRALIPSRSPATPLEVETTYGNLHDRESLDRAMASVDCAINAVGIIAERGSNTFQSVHVHGVENTLAAAEAAGVARFIHISAMGARADSPSRYHRTKREGERLVMESGLDYSIIRPSIVFGPKDEFINMLARMVRRFPLIPVIGPGGNLFQPVYSRDLARLVRNLVVENTAPAEAVAAGGPEQLSYNAVITLLKELLRRPRKPVLHLPLVPLGLTAKLFNQPLTFDQWLMLQEDNVLGEREYLRFRELLGAEPSALGEVLPTYLLP